MHTLRPNEFCVLGGPVGVNSAHTDGELNDVGEDDWGFIHWSQSWFILDKAVLSRSASHNYIQSLIINKN